MNQTHDSVHMKQLDRETIAKNQAELLQAAEEKAQSIQHSKNKYTARERLDLLLDPDSFVEIAPFWCADTNSTLGISAVITGYGEISGRKVAVYAQDFSVRGGTLGKIEGDKIIHLLDMAMQMRVPIIGLLDSGGARIQEGVVALGQYGRIFQKTCQASGLVPQISLILGPCAGGAVYSPALTDFIIMTRDTSHMFVTGPDVVRAATGEDVSFEELGGAQVHNSSSGVAHYLAEDEDDALDYVRTLLDYLPSSCDEPGPRYQYEEGPADIQCAQAVAELVPVASRQPYDMVEVISCLVDYGEFVQIHELFAPSVIIGMACLNGESVGIVANQPGQDAGTLNVDASEKVARFVRFCDAFQIPVITLVDVPGYRPGPDQEQAGIIRRGAKVIFAYANATIPMVTVVLRKAYGGAYIVMGSKSIGADINYAWPGAEIAVMGAEGAVDILRRRELMQAIENGDDVTQLRKQLIDEYTLANINSDLSVQTGEIDELIAPSATRSKLIQALDFLRTKERSHLGVKRHGNGPL